MESTSYKAQNPKAALNSISNPLAAFHPLVKELLVLSEPYRAILVAGAVKGAHQDSF
jgi:hypothetical protein